MRLIIAVLIFLLERINEREKLSYREQTQVETYLFRLNELMEEE